jgi:hypothetical protein
MSLFADLTPAQVVANNVLAQLNRDYHQKMAFYNSVINEIYATPNVSADDVVAAFGDNAQGVMDYINDAASAANNQNSDAVASSPITQTRDRLRGGGIAVSAAERGG